MTGGTAAPARYPDAVVIYPTLPQAVRLANIGLIAAGNVARDAELEVSLHGRAYVEAADVCVAAPSQLESAVTVGLRVTDDQHAALKQGGCL